MSLEKRCVVVYSEFLLQFDKVKMDFLHILFSVGLFAIFLSILPFILVFLFVHLSKSRAAFENGADWHGNSSDSSDFIVHFVTGGFSGATKVALEIVRGSNQNQNFKSLLVLRKKRSTDPIRVQQAIDSGIKVLLVPGWAHLATVAELTYLLKKYNPRVLVCHGFSEHLWGRYAGLLAKVPSIIHVEHNSRERYTPWRLYQARWLSRHTDKIVGVSEGVRQNLLRLNFPHDNTIAINNGINLEPYRSLKYTNFKNRAPNIVMAARFAKQKDHLTLIRAVGELVKRGFSPDVYLAGTGNNRHSSRAESLVTELELSERVHFLGFCNSVPDLLLSNQICVLSTHYEGMPLSLSEGMAAGCAVIGSSVVGVKEMINHEDDGLLVEPNSPKALADGLEVLLTDVNFSERLGLKARERAKNELSTEGMVERYEHLIGSLLERKL